MSKVERVLASIGLLFITTSISLLAAETIVRIFLKPNVQTDVTVQKGAAVDKLCEGNTDPYDKPGECYFSNDGLPMMSFSTYFGYVPTPNTDGRGYHTNAATMRYDRDLAPRKEKGETRIFVTGGSTAWGAGVTQDQLYTTKAEEALAKQFSDRQVKVICAGVGGYVSLHELLRYMIFIRPLSPDVWVMYTGSMDVYAAYRGRSYVLSPDMMELRSVVLSGAAEYPIMRERFSEASNAAAADQRGPLWGAYDIKLHWLLDTSLYKLRLRMIAQKTEGLPPDTGGTSSSDTALQPEEAVKIFLQNIAVAAHMAHDDGIKLVVMLGPSVYSTAKHLADFETAMVRTDESTFPGLVKYYKAAYPLLRQQLAQASKEERFVFIDADNAIANEKRAVFAEPGHLGDRGNSMIGAFIAETLGKVIQ